MAIQPIHVHYAWDTLNSHLTDQEPKVKPSFSNDNFPLFVSWHNNERLRGCIGNFHAMPLHSGLKDYAIISATKDSRFRPITAKELSQLDCSVSLLTQFEVGQDAMDWQVGKHGIWIEFHDGTAKKTATYLPEVAHEQGWTKVEAIDSLLRKGGYQGPITHKIRDTIKLTRYQSEKLTLSYDDHLLFLSSEGC
jgi:uncharacterized protein (TIGR00296 family)